ncbi:MAG: histidine--tRNA ligase [Anaerolineae bacterium]|nr:histidine--tRNA ligase [Anaerolineae bacterium]
MTIMPHVEPRLPRGMRDIPPQQMILRQYVMGVIEKTFKAYGFEPLETPAVELRSVLMGKYGEDAERLIYDVSHVGGKEQLALRYDLTVPLTRFIAMNPGLRLPFKRYQIAPVWRAERPAKGRYRQFYQCDADIVGTASMLADAEIITLIHDVLSRLGFTNYTIFINHRQLLAALGEYAGVQGEQAGALYRSIDKLDKIGEEGVRQEMLAGGVPAKAADRLLSLLRMEGTNAELLADMRRRLEGLPAAEKGLKELEELIQYLHEFGVPEERYQLAFSMVRGLSYYTGPIYETIVQEPKIGSITGGGRYDDLIGLFTGRSLPVTGTTVGIERIIDVIEELGMYPPSLGRTTAQLLVTIFDESTRPASIQLCQELRRQDIHVELSFEVGKIGSQIRYASQKGIPFVAILGPDEVQAGKVTLRDLDKAEQVTVDRNEVVPLLRQWLAERQHPSDASEGW